MTNRYYKMTEPSLPLLPPGRYEQFGEEYRGFVVIKEGDYMLYSCTTLEHGKPPLDLRGGYTTPSKMKQAIDDFHSNEEKKKNEDKSKSRT
jgi:hypothetical protein